MGKQDMRKPGENDSSRSPPQHEEMVASKGVMRGQGEEYEIASCEGSITCERDLDRLKHIRDKTQILVSFGACASIGSHRTTSGVS
jgi:coenzyme F420-reducing hydrogenase gamma subunit